jgi:hypothetical protein
MFDMPIYPKNDPNHQPHLQTVNDLGTDKKTTDFVTNTEVSKPTSIFTYGSPYMIPLTA